MIINEIPMETPELTEIINAMEITDVKFYRVGIRKFGTPHADKVSCL